MEISAQLFTVRDFTQTKEDLKETLRKVKEIGYDSVQLSAIGAIDSQNIKEYLMQYDLKVCATHTPADRILNDTKKVIEEHKMYGCDYIGLGGYFELWDTKTYTENKDGADAFIKLYSRAMEEIYDNGLKFMYHNHAIEFKKVSPNETIMDYFAQKVSSEKMGFLVDFYWSQVGGINPLEFIDKYHDRMNVVHFKDLIPEGNTPMIAVVGEGNINYKAIYEKLSDYGTKYAAVEQDDCNGECPFECLKRSFDNIKKFK